jgi:hypothetical protein
MAPLHDDPPISKLFYPKSYQKLLLGEKLNCRGNKNNNKQVSRLEFLSWKKDKGFSDRSILAEGEEFESDLAASPKCKGC